MDPERAAGELDAVADEVVRDRARRARDRCRSSVALSSVGRVNGWCTAFQRSTSSSHSAIGMSIDPEELPARLVDQPELAAEVEAQQRRARARPSRGSSAPKSTVCPGSAPNARARPRRGTSRSASGPRRRRRRRRRRAPSRPTASRPPRASRASPRESSCGTRRKRTAVGVREDPELRAARDLGRLLDLEPEAQVGLVGAVAQVGLVAGHAAGTASRARRRGTRARSARRSARSARTGTPGRGTPSRRRAGSAPGAGRRADPRPGSSGRSGSSARSRR